MSQRERTKAQVPVVELHEGKDWNSLISDVAVDVRILDLIASPGQEIVDQIVALRKGYPASCQSPSVLKPNAIPVLQKYLSNDEKSQWSYQKIGIRTNFWNT